MWQQLSRLHADQRLFFCDLQLSFGERHCSVRAHLSASVSACFQRGSVDQTLVTRRSWMEAVCTRARLFPPDKGLFSHVQEHVQDTCRTGLHFFFFFFFFFCFVLFFPVIFLFVQARARRISFSPLVGGNVRIEDNEKKADHFSSYGTSKVEQKETEMRNLNCCIFFFCSRLNTFLTECTIAKFVSNINPFIAESGF